MNILDFKKMKEESRPISMVTCYDYWTAALLNETKADTLLVGDSVAMVMHGYSDTLMADVPMMAMHVSAVRRGAPSKFIVADMPFLSVRKGLGPAMDAVEALMRAGANAVKIEGVFGHEEVIKNIVGSGIPVVGHLGLTPQSIHALGGYKVQGKKADNSSIILEEAGLLEKLGASVIVLECLDTATATKVTHNIKIPTIGIGAGVGCDGQVLVLQDLLGGNPTFSAKFVRQYAHMGEIIKEAVNHYDSDVKERLFPSKEESYL